jgi:hypothetical protein
MFGKLVILAIVVSIVIKYFVIPVFTFLGLLVSRIGAQGPMKHFLVVSLFTLLVFTFGVFVWLVAKFLKLK